MMRLFVPILLLLGAALAGGTIYHLRWVAAAQLALAQARQGAEPAGLDLGSAASELQQVQVRAVATSSDLDAARVELRELRAEREQSKQRIKQLESELNSEIKRRQDVDGLIENTAKAILAERERHNREIWESRRYMPEGVRLALVTVNERLREDGHPEFRFLKAMKIEDKVMYDVQVLDRDLTTLAGAVLIAKQVTIEVDRGKGAVIITFKDGYRRGPGGREAFSKTGKAIVFPDANGREWESRLPFLVAGRGEYPVEVAEVRKPRMGRTRRDGWRKRVNALLAGATTEKRYRLETFRNLESGRFSEALLLGYDKSKKLAMSVEAEWMSIQVNDRGKYVELVLENGTLRKLGGATPIPDGGYRIRLTGVEPSQAIGGMLGMVKRQ